MEVINYHYVKLKNFIMDLKFITCSGANEYTNVDVLFALYAQFSCIEFGIQVSGKKCSENSPRLAWVRNLHKKILEHRVNLPLALHLNQDWVCGFYQDDISPELHELLSYSNSAGEPLFQRVQLNFKIGREIAPQIDMLEKQMRKFPQVRFILSYNASNAEVITELYQRHNVVFDCLFDESFGEGILPEKRHAPVFPDVIQGYAGGLSPENVSQELSKIALVQPMSASVFIDAEGKLKGEDRHFSYLKAHDFVANALLWQKNNLRV